MASTQTGQAQTATSFQGRSEDADDRERLAQKDSDVRFAQLAESIPQLVFCSDQSGQVTYVNRRWVDYTGISLAEVRAGGWTRAVHPDDVPAIQEQWQIALPHGQPWEVEYRIRRASDGAYRWFLGRSAPGRRTPEGAATAPGAADWWYGTATDIHDQKMADHKLAELLQSEQETHRLVAAERNRLSSLFSQAPALVNVLRGPLHVFELVHPLVQRLLGRDVTGLPLCEAVPAAREQGLVGLFDRVYRDGQPYSGRELPLRMPAPGGPAEADAPLRYYDLTLQPWREAGPAGQIVGVMAFAVEVTESVRVRKELERSSGFMTRLQAVTAGLSRAQAMEEAARIALGEAGAAMGADQGVMMRVRWDEGRIELAGQLGGDPATLALWATGRSLSEDGFLQRAARDDTEYYVESLAALGNEADARRVRSRGIAAFLVLPLKFDHKVLGVLGLAWARERPFPADERAFLRALGDQCGQALERARIFKQMQQAIVLRDDFLSIAGHELNTPLAALQLHIQGLQKLVQREHALRDNERLTDRLDRSAGNIDRLRRLIDQLLDVSRITSGRLTLEREELDLAELVMEIMGRMAETAARAGCSIDLSLRGRQVGSWDKLRLEQVVTNLLGNALKYGGGKPVSVTVKAEEGWAVLLVADQGIGIDPASQERIFGRFERAVSTRNFGGLGLGLWIVRRIIEESGGTIQVRSAPGQGSTFTVKLPLLGSKTEPRPEPKPEPKVEKNRERAHV